MGCEACHNDGDRSNNHLSNLRWDTKSNNQKDRVEHGTSDRKLTDKEAQMVRQLYEDGGFTQKELAAQFGVAGCTISFIINKVRYK